MKHQEIIEKAIDFVKTYMKEHENPNLLFHNLTHTEAVVTAAAEIARYYKLDQKDFSNCIIAAWFHDIGYYEDLLDHERVGAEKAEEFLINNSINQKTIDVIKNCILATKVPQNPRNRLEQIICDADLYHFGTDDFSLRDCLMRKELEAIHHVRINKDEWRTSTIRLLESHHFHTDYCKNFLNKKKKQNLETLKKRSEEHALLTNECPC